MCPSASVLAQQLTHIELERLSYIGPEEFVQAFAKESPHLETSFKDMKKTRNLESYVQWFNRLSYFVATEVCKHAKKKQRVRVVEYWIEAARECFNIGNFNSLMAIIAGLNMSPISRLKKTVSLFYFYRCSLKNLKFLMKLECVTFFKLSRMKEKMKIFTKCLEAQLQALKNSRINSVT